MNKKISTLLAGAALLGAVSANAGNPVVKLKEGENTSLYQLLDKTTNQVLSMTDDGVLKAVPVGSITNLQNTLWCVNVTDKNQGQNPIFDFQNKGTGRNLDLTLEGINFTALQDLGVIANKAYATSSSDIVVGGDVLGWALSKTYKTSLEKEKALYSYFTTDSIVGLNVKSNGNVVLTKAYATEAIINGLLASGDFSAFTLVNADPYRLKADDINGLLGQQTDKTAGVKLKFTPDEKGVEALTDFVRNPFSFDKFLAENVTAAGNADYVYIKSVDGKKYLNVDSAYTNSNGAKFLAFNWNDTIKTTAAIEASAMNEQYKFAFTYYPSNDSLIIQVKAVRTKTTETSWAAVTPTVATLDNLVAGAGHVDGDKNFITVQDLIANQVRIVTVADKKESDVNLGYYGCSPVASTKTTIADGVYLIKNTKTNKYLAVPIYNNATWVDNATATDTPEWVSLNELQNLKHMPAYQWVILKDYTTDKNNISPIKATNREYSTISGRGQLNKKEGGKNYYFSGLAAASIFDAADSLEFIPVEKEFYSDKYLGYKKLNKDSLIVNKYTFNYWHPYSSDKYIAVVKDSTMTVKVGMTAFKIGSTDTEHKYGFNPSTDNAGTRIPGLAYLVRTMYQITYENAIFGDHTSAKENKYTVSLNNAITDSVYFKENNCIARGEGQSASHYYAILEAGTTGAILPFKAGVSDYDADASLKAQTLNETRTSAFYIAPDKTPLYRRFDNAAVGENAGAMRDATDSLYFMESIREEYLMDEANDKLQHSTVDYAGIWNKEKANGKLAFRLDTAWVRRGAGEVKPQYLVSAFRQVIEGEKVIPCTETTNKHITADGEVTDDPYQCVHAKHEKTPAFIYGKYLVNYSDSAKVNKDDTNPYLFNSKAVSGGSYTRVGFVTAVQYGDSLYVLAGKYKGMTAEQLKNEGIEAIKADYEKNYKSFINNLRGDIHKNVTWSFRYVNPDKAAQAYIDGEEGENNSFLIESNVYAKGEVYQTSKTGYDGRAIAPKDSAAWLKMHNGCLVLTDANATFTNVKTGGDGALVFNAYQKTKAEDMVTSNDGASVSEVSVIAGEGQVTIAGAAGKKVVISNILGQVKSEKVIASDSDVIAVPAGVAVVAVEGEEAVKAIVK